MKRWFCMLMEPKDSSSVQDIYYRKRKGPHRKAEVHYGYWILWQSTSAVFLKLSWQWLCIWMNTGNGILVHLLGFDRVEYLSSFVSYHTWNCTINFEAITEDRPKHFAQQCLLLENPHYMFFTRETAQGLILKVPYCWTSFYHIVVLKIP